MWLPHDRPRRIDIDPKTSAWEGVLEVAPKSEDEEAAGNAGVHRGSRDKVAGEACAHEGGEPDRD